MNHPTLTLQPSKLPARLECDGNETLSHVVTRFTSTHTPLFAFDEQKKFMGLLTARNTLYGRRYNPSTRIDACLITPPLFTRDSSMQEVLRGMSSLRLYTLPIQDEDGVIVGVVRAKDILSQILKNPSLGDTLAEKIVPHKPIALLKEASVGDAFQIFSKHKISRLIVVDKAEKLVGLVTVRGLITSYLSPTPAQRFSSRSSSHVGQHNYSFDGEQPRRSEQPVMKFVTPISHPYTGKRDGRTLLKSLLKSPYNALIIVDELHHPQGIITLRDVLKIAEGILKKAPRYPVVWGAFPEHLPEVTQQLVMKKMQQLCTWIDKQEPVLGVRVASKTVFSKERKPTLYELHVKINTDHATYDATHKEKNFTEAVMEVIRQVKKQVRRKHA